MFVLRVILVGVILVTNHSEGLKGWLVSCLCESIMFGFSSGFNNTYSLGRSIMYNKSGFE